jgi:hypothetical protein
MWREGPVDPDETLRQGDLLRDLVIPILKYPFRASHTVGGEVEHDDRIVFLLKKSADLLIISQCCTIDHNDFIAVAIVRQYRNMPEQDVQGLLADEPLDDGPYLMDVFRLHPLAFN